MKKWLHDKASAVFWVTLIMYILIWCTVSYVGVYVTDVAGPLLVLSGITIWFTGPKPDEENAE